MHPAHAAGEPLVQLVVLLHDGDALDRIQSLVAMAAPRARVSGAWEAWGFGLLVINGHGAGAVAAARLWRAGAGLGEWGRGG